MSMDNFLDILDNSTPEELTEESLYRNFISAITLPSDYKKYLSKIYTDYPNAEHIAIMGSGNWGYSLNPDKNFRKFGQHSDIDIVIICIESFNSAWDELREYHRKNYYFLSHNKKSAIKRNGENIYSGFISPKWIPNKKSKARFRYDILCNNYSEKTVGYRVVNMMYFKNKPEVIDYYSRGFKLAKSRS